MLCLLELCAKFFLSEPPIPDFPREYFLPFGNKKEKTNQRTKVKTKSQNLRLCCKEKKKTLKKFEEHLQYNLELINNLDMMDEKTTNAGSPVIAEQPSQPNLTQSIRVTRAKAAQAAAKAAAKHTTVADDEDAALIRAEDRMIEDDEEITSEEEDGETVAEKMERKLVTVALVKSVVDTGGSSSGGGSGQKTTSFHLATKKKQPLPAPSDQSGTRYGLRKRRRPAGNDLKRLEHNQFSGTSTGGGNLARLLSGRPTTNGKSKGTAITLPLIALPSSSSTTMVPNPLASAPIPPPPILPTATILSQSTTAAPPDQAIKHHTATVPCPLAAPPPAFVFNAQIAPETHQAPAMSNEPVPEQVCSEKRKVTINEDPVRMRGLSIDLDSVGLAFAEEDEEGSNANTGDLLPSSSAGGRGRAFSFECFAFGISADEPLPPLGGDTSSEAPTTTSSSGKHEGHESFPIAVGDDPPRPDEEISSGSGYGGRPRGESIIFDPSSFQEGGIHEQSALETARAPISDIPGLSLRSNTSTAIGTIKPDDATSSMKPLVPSQSSVAPAVTTKTIVESGFPAPTSSSRLPAVTSYTATTTTESSTTTTTVTVPASAATAAAASMTMELLNKDGRIGIYLPEARKARIARFHAKRARRIWRKRIKYDCRKKLADSRPRIKGRFVKRSDMEEE
ncbi:hypothetical protein ACA910_000357 [Epithemia clementina (nom. ined.)]